MCIPIAVSWHDFLTPSYALFRVPILQHFNLSTYPLALRPGEHLRSINWVLSLFFFLLLCRRHLQYAQFVRAATGILWLAVLYCTFGWIQVFTEATSIYWVSGVPTFQRDLFFGTLINPNHAGFFLAACLPLSLSCSPRQRWFFLLILSAGIIQTQSRAAIFSGLMTFCAWGFLQKSRSPQWFRMTSVLFVISLPIYLWWQRNELLSEQFDIHTFTAQRSYIWQDSWNAIALSPYIGIGMGGFPDAFSIVKSLPLYQQTSHAHQELLETLLLFGIGLGSAIILAFLLLYWTAFRQVRITNDRNESQWLSSAFCGLLVFIPASLVDFPFRVGSLVLLFIFLASPFIPVHFAKNKRRFLLSLMVFFVLSTGWSTINMANRHSPFAWLEYHLQQQDYSALLHSAPLHTYAMQRYIEKTAPEDELELVTHLTTYAPTNAFSWILYARTHHKYSDYTKACHGWHEALKLNLGRKITPFVSEALTCSPNLTEAILILPQDSTVLTTAAVLLDKQKATNSAFYLMKKAADIDHLGLERYARFLVGKKDYVKAWSLIRSSETRSCTTAKTKLLVGFSLRFEETPSFAIEALDYCGEDPSFKRMMLLGQLRNSNPEALTNALTDFDVKTNDVMLFEHVIHSLSASGEISQACQFIRERYVSQATSKFTATDIQRCSQNKLPERYPFPPTIRGNDLP